MRAIVDTLECAANCLPIAHVVVQFEEGEFEKLQKQKDHIEQIKKVSMEAVCKDIMGG